LKVWASLLSAVDMAWGTLASAIAAAIATAVLSKGR
jgi:uncharacterized membrane protein